MDIKPCPRCESMMKLIRIPGTMKSFPKVSLHCIAKDCLWNMSIEYDEFAKDDPSANLIEQWNEGIGNMEKKG